MYKSIENEIFHVHTYRCRHASDEGDEIYVKKAISLGASRIVFTDHAPFPGDSFTNRMLYKEFPEYISSLRYLKDKYASTIEVVIGLEIEYLPSYEEYYRELKKMSEIEVLMLGQHMFEISPGICNFRYKNLWFPQIAESLVQGIKSGYFDGVAHPDRIFKQETEWTDEMERLSVTIIREAGKRGIFLEQNESSKIKLNHYWPQFWEIAEDMKKNYDPELQIIKGLDAHSSKEIVL